MHDSRPIAQQAEGKGERTGDKAYRDLGTAFRATLTAYLKLAQLKVIR
jgi:hypothetical protein